MKAPLVVDIETVGNALTGKVVSVAYKVVGEEDTPRLVFPGHRDRQEPYPDDLLEMMADPERPFVSFTTYDARFLRLQGVEVAGPFYDIQVMCWVYNENQPLSLEATVRRYLGVQMDKRIKVRDGAVLFLCDDLVTLVPIDEAPLEQLARYNIDDTYQEAALFEDIWERLYESEWLDYFLEEEVPFTECLTDTMCRGLPLDLERTAQFAEELEVQHSDMKSELLDSASLPETFNINSNDQLAGFLYNKVYMLEDSIELTPEEMECLKSCLDGEHEDCDLCAPADMDNPMCGGDGECLWHQGEDFHIADCLPDGFIVDKLGRTLVHGTWAVKGRNLKPSVKTDAGKWSVSKPTLKTNVSTAVDPWVQQLLLYRQVDKLLTTYLRRFPEVAVDGRIYGRFNQTGTKTGRLSSSEPNLQNIPSHGALGPRTRDLFRVHL